ncbi:MAG: 5'-methylthioadenosine/adenosylhomocysteine nucleosidase [Firmicutes bacterium]|nr:5'-methylthioadenosine/adenosylhomocysteine nucleosidase [Bacillota bacterium]
MIGIIGAMDKELAYLFDVMKQNEVIDIADKRFFVGEIFDKKVVLVKSGVGKVNAAITTTLLLKTFSIDYVMNIGVAGGLIPAKEGNIILAEAVSYFDVSLIEIDHLPFGKIGDEPLQIFTDSNLRKKAITVFDKLKIPYLIGNIVSGDQFVVSTRVLLPILNEIDNVLACEMEGMAIGMTCYKFNTPFLSIRGISDVIDDPIQTKIYKDIVTDVAKKTTDFAIAFLEA